MFAPFGNVPKSIRIALGQPQTTGGMAEARTWHWGLTAPGLAGEEGESLKGQS